MAVHSGPRPTSTRDGMILYAAVAAGSMIGALLRALASLALQLTMGSGFPWGTLFVNITGSLVIGFYAALTGPDGRLFVGARQRQFVMTGICGGYTTFSAFSLETFRLVESGQLSLAGINVSISVITWLMAVWLGHSLATRLNRLKE
jgi:fluoride exporter